MRAAYLAGPYSLYVDCRPKNFSPTKKTFITADQPQFEPQLHPGLSFQVKLSCNTFKERYEWSIDVVSQMIFSVSQLTKFEITITQNNADARKSSLGLDTSSLASGVLAGIMEHTPCIPNLTTIKEESGVIDERMALNLLVNIHDTLDLWNLPIPDTSKPIHLVILTHGLHSNVSADMLFLKEMIDESSANIVVKGYFGNNCKTERGIKYLGSRVAEYVVKLTKNPSLQSANKISFIGHSLGGLVQTFAIAYLETNYPWLFRRLRPVNFITLASPMLGVVHENPAYVKIALSAGIAGKTGQDLGLQYVEADGKPLLLLLPSGPTHKVLKLFIRRTAYANAFNDGIVPLRTSALLYLDYEGLASVLGYSKHDRLNSGAVRHSQSSDKIPRHISPINEPQPSKKVPHDSADNQYSQTLAFGAVLSYFMPQKYRQTNENDAKESLDTADSTEPSRKFHKPSMLESATSILLPPLPPMKYITDPSSRENVIIHDEIYQDSDLPATNEAGSGELVQEAREEAGGSKSNSLSTVQGNEKGMMNLLATKSEEIRQLLMGSMTEHYEEEIAREYHKNMLWRKVLVNLMPDAHNNIVVRRRFPNAYGWPVIEHLVNNHFSDKEIEHSELIREDTLETCADGAELTRILSMEAIKRENAELDRQPILDGEHAWININKNQDFFDGPAGIFTGLSEKMFKLKQDWEVNGIKALRMAQPGEGATEEAKDAVAANQEVTETRVMGGFL